MDSSLYHFKEKLKEALALVPAMSTDNKAHAVEHWNDLAKQFNHIIHGTDNSSFNSEAMNQDSQIRSSDNSGTMYSNSIACQDVQDDTAIINNYNSPPSINSSLVGTDMKHDQLNQYHQNDLIAKNSIYGTTFVNRSPISNVSDCKDHLPDHLGLKIGRESMANMSSNLPNYRLNETLMSCDGDTPVGSASSDTQTLPSLISGDPYNVMKHSAILSQVPDHIEATKSDLTLAAGLGNEVISHPVSDAQIMNYLPGDDLDLSAPILTKTDRPPINSSTDFGDNLLAGSLGCPRKTADITPDIGNGQFDRGPKEYSVGEYSQFYSSNTAVLMGGAGTNPYTATNRDGSFTLGERPLQQIQTFNQIPGSVSTSSPDSISAYPSLKLSPHCDTEGVAQLIVPEIDINSIFFSESNDGLLDAAIKKETAYPGGANKTSNNTSPNTCDVCGKSGFSTKGNLKRHMRAHSGEKPFKCEYCESCFTEKKSLKIHVRRHTGEKPYKCDICGKLFSQTGVLQSHMALHLNERKFECNKCGKAFRQRSQLKLHLMRHDGVKRLECSTCMAKFLTKGDLERHMRIHTGERPYACKICSKTFTRQQSLNEHINRHTGRKPYDCKFCDKAFSEMSACYKHAKVHKKQDQVQQVALIKPTPNPVDPSG